MQVIIFGEKIKKITPPSFCSKSVDYAGGWRDRLWPDGWTAVTADGKRSAQFEHTLLVTFLSLCHLCDCEGHFP